MELLPPVIALGVGTVDGFVGHLDNTQHRWFDIKREYTTYTRGLTMVTGLALDALGFDPNVAVTLSVAGAAMLGSRIGLGIARGSAKPPAGGPTTTPPETSSPIVRNGQAVPDHTHAVPTAPAETGSSGASLVGHAASVAAPILGAVLG